MKQKFICMFLLFGCGDQSKDTGTEIIDIDGDGYAAEEDCNDDDPSVYDASNDNAGKQTYLLKLVRHKPNTLFSHLKNHLQIKLCVQSHASKLQDLIGENL